jgi:hypothetical protein
LIVLPFTTSHTSTVYIHFSCDFSIFQNLPISPPPQLFSITISKMLFTKIACAAAFSAVIYASPSPANNAASGGTGTTLSANAIQSGSFNDGSNEIGAAEVGQALSLTSQNNFINNCAGKTLTNGLQITTGSCNGISK